jgi:hypothetical protein
MSLSHKKILPDYLKPDDNGRTPLHGAVCNGQLDQVMTALKASGEKLTLDHFLIKDHNGRTPLHGAAGHGHLDQVMVALEASGEKLTLDHFLIKDDDGSTPLHGAAGHGHLDQIMVALKASGEKLTLDHFLIKDHDGYTPLYWAACNGHLDQVFIPSYWTGRVGEMIDLWEQVPQECKEKAEEKDADYFQKLRDEAILLSVQSVPRLDLEALSQAVRANVSIASPAADRNLEPVQVK